MDLTEEQRAIVEIDKGRHLVLAPPGSGKTEMLSQRILRALRHAVPPNRTLCATFTNRAAFEMRERVHAEAKGEALPDVGNLHHHCERFLRAAGVIPGIESFNRDDEARRLLYVAMSRARRHLFLFSGREGGVVPWIEECFTPGYVGYYLRKAQGDDLRDDWMFKWERLADLNRSGCCGIGSAREALRSSCAPVARIALKMLRHHRDGIERRMILLACLRREFGYAAPAESFLELQKTTSGSL